MMARTFVLFFAIQFCVAGTAVCQTAQWYKTSEEIKKECADCYVNGDRDNYCTHAMELYSCIGLIDSVMAMGDRAYGYQLNNPRNTDTTKPNYEFIPARDYILQQTENYRVVMLNEAHNYAVTRVFTASLLEGLRKQGFNYLGCEGISPKKIDILNDNGYPTTNTCCFLQEPQFANMVREALNLGFIVFGYDYITKEIYESKDKNPRERMQAGKIYEILQRDSSAKIVIHAGHGHISEDTSFKAMGYYFKTFSHIDPFTVDQSIMIEHREVKCEQTIYQRVTPWLEFPAVLKDGATILANKGNDVQVYHPKTEYTNGRADWLYSSYLISHPIKLSNTTFPVLIKVYLKSEFEKTPDIAVPVDAIELFKEQKTVDIFAPFKGDYLVQINQLEPYQITIK